MTDEYRAMSDDDALSALLDDALPPIERQRLRERLVAEADLARRFDALRKADDAVRAAYSGIADEPLPQHIVALVDRELSGDTRDRVVELSARKKSTSFRAQLLSAPTAIAASLALAVGFLSSYVVLTQLEQPDTAGLIAGAGDVPPDSALHEVLQSAVTAETRRLNAATTAVPRLTFVDRSGEYCRHVELAGAGGSAHALACRRDGEWRVEFASFSPPQPAAPDGMYRPAARDVPAALDTALDTMIDGEPLGRDAERDAISRAWATPRDR